MSQFTQRLKFVKCSDLIQILPMLLGLVCGKILSIFRRNIWLICERKNEARDNGFWFFKYLNEKHKEIDSVYAINTKSVDFNKVNKIGKVIPFGSLKHWIYYFAAKWNISSQKEGKPNAAICYVLEVYLGFRKNRIYLKHGIIKDSQRWIFNDVSKITVLCCASKYEQEYIQEHFGYRENQVKLVGLCRFDNLLSPHDVKRQIVVMPTMREWLRTFSSDTLKYEEGGKFKQSEYYLRWTSFLKNETLKSTLERNDITLLFYPHPAMQKYVEDFISESKNIVIASSKQFDMQQLLMESSMLITDYSSIYFDFAYMRKPMCYYQFDYEKYRRGQYQEGYFSYNENGFGPVFSEENDVVNYLEKIIKNNLLPEAKYNEKMKDFFAFEDQNNCERTYTMIKELESE